MMLDVVALMEGLSLERPIFHSEADFQHALAWRIHEAMPQGHVRLEFKPFPAERVYLDIWLPNVGLAIELKYLTRRLLLEWAGEPFALRDQAAQDIGRYNFLKDIQRLERTVSDFDPAAAGFAILLTNDSSYWKTSLRTDTVDAPFRLHDERRIMGDLAWSVHAGPGTTKGRQAPIRLRDFYDLRWRDYSRLGEGHYQRFRYLLVEIPSSSA